MTGVSKQLFIFFLLSVACIMLQSQLAKVFGVIYQIDVKTRVYCIMLQCIWVIGVSR